MCLRPVNSKQPSGVSGYPETLRVAVSNKLNLGSWLVLSLGCLPYKDILIVIIELLRDAFLTSITWVSYTITVIFKKEDGLCFFHV